MHKIMFFSKRKIILKKCECLPHLKFSDLLSETHIFFYLALGQKTHQHNSFLAIGDFCHLLITFANSLDPDQDQQNIDPVLDPNGLTL